MLPRFRVKTALVAALLLCAVLSLLNKGWQPKSGDQANRTTSPEATDPAPQPVTAEATVERQATVHLRLEKNAAVSARKQPAGADPASVDPGVELRGGKAPRHFYASGHRVDLVEERGWVAVKLAPGAKVAEVTTALRAELGSPAGTEGSFNEMTGIIAERVKGAGETPTQEEADDARGRANAMTGVGRVMRAFKNGDLPPIIDTGEICVDFKPGVDKATATTRLAALGATIMRPLGGYSPNGYLVEVDAARDALEVANTLREQEGVNYAHPNFIWPKEKAWVPNDPLYGQQWHLKNTGSNGTTGGTANEDIDAERAWEITRGSSSVVVAIMDDGVDTSHEDFSTPGKIAGGWDFLSNDNNPRPSLSSDNHGTACAGLAVAAGNNGTGVCGVAPNCRLMAVRMLGNQTNDAEAAAFRHAMNNGASVISCSYAYTLNANSTFIPLPDNINAAINDVADNGRGGKGCVVIFAAGNNNRNANLSGYNVHPKVITVAASTNAGLKSDYSNFGQCIDLAAPGGPSPGDMMTVDRTGTVGYTTNNYEPAFNGTSAATPVVAGVAALLLSKEPNLTREQVRQRLIDSADFIGGVTYDGNGHHDWYGFGRVNAWRALTYNDETDPTVTIRVPGQNLTTTSLTAADGQASDSGSGIYQVQIAISDSQNRWWNWGNNGWSGVDMFIDSLDYHMKLATVSGGTWSIALPSLPAGSYRLHAKSIDNADLVSEWAFSDYVIDPSGPQVTIALPQDGYNYATAPQASGTAVDNITERRFALFRETDGQWYHWTSGTFAPGDFNYGLHVTSQTGGGENWTLPLPSLAAARYQLHAMAIDTSNRASDWVRRDFRVNLPPTVAVTSPAHASASDELGVISGTATDPSGKGLQGNTVKFTLYQNGDFWTGSAWSPTMTQLTAQVYGGNWIYTSIPTGSQVRSGQYFISSSVADVTGAASVPQPGVNQTNFTIDRSPPQVAIGQPVNGTIITTKTYSFQGTAQDNGALSTVALFLRRDSDGKYWNGSTWQSDVSGAGLSSNLSGNAWSCSSALPSSGNNPANQLVNGSYHFIAIAVDAAGNQTQTDSVVSVDFHEIYTWTGWTMRDGVQGNDNNSWGDPSNWEPYGVPGPADVAIIGNGDTVVSTVDRTVHGLRLQAGGLAFSAGAAATLTTTAASEWTGGWLSTTWQNNGTLSLAGGGRQLSTGARLRNAGTVTWSSGITQGWDSTTITNLPGGLWILAGTGDVFDNFYYGNQFINQGTLRQTSAATVNFNDWTYTLGGEIQKQGGTLEIYSNTSLSAGTTFTGSGSFRYAGGTLGVTGTVNNAAGTFEFADGTLAASGAVLLNGAYQWSGGAWSGNLQVTAGSSLAITGGCQLNTSALLSNAGTVSWDSAHPLRGYDSVTVTNLPTGVWKLEQTGEAFSNFYGNNSFINQGLLEKTGTGQTELRHWTYLLPGETKVSAAAGTLRVEANTTLAAGAKLSGAGTFDYGAGLFTLDGEVTSTVTLLKVSGGTMSCAATAKIQGNWTWTGGALSGTFENPTGRTMQINGGCQLNGAAHLTNKGTVVWQGLPLTGYDSSTVTNAAGATWEFATAGDAFNNFYGNNHFFNLGQMKFSATTGTLLLEEWTYHQDASFVASAAVQTTSAFNVLEGSSFTGAGSFAFHGSTVLKGASTFTATSTVAGGVFTGEAAGLVSGTLNWSSGTFVGVTKVASGAALRIQPGGKTLGGFSQIESSGEVAWQGGDLTGHDTSKIIVRNGGVFRIEGTGTFGNFYGNNRLVIEDGASLIKTNAGENAVHWAFDNDGTATINGGLLTLHGGGTGDGAFTGSGGVLQFTAGPHVLEAGATLGGGVEITGGSLVATGNAGGTIDLKGGLVGGVAPAIFSFGPGCTWTSGTIAGLSKVVTGGSLATSGTAFKGVGGFSTLTIDGLLQWAGGAPIDGHDTSNIVVTTGGKFEVTADGDLFSRFYSNNRLTIAGTLEKSAGAGALWIDEWFVELSGTIRCKSGSVDISADSSVLPGAGFDGSGRTRWVAGNIGVRGTSTIQSGATVEFAGASINGNPDGTACFQGGAIDWSAGWLNGWIVLNSTTTLTGPAGKVIGGFSELRNAGTMVTGGSGTLTAWDSSRLRNLPGATLTCVGGNHFANFYGNNRLVNEGTMTLGSAGAPGRQTMDWAFEQTSTGRLLLDVAGPNAVTPAPEFDNLSVGSGMFLAGRLEVTKVNGYAPPADTIFPFIGGSGVSATFAVVQAPGFSVEYEGAAAKLRAGAAGLAFQTWATTHGLLGDDAEADADPDHDNIVNFLEYAFNLDPLEHSAAPTASDVIVVEGQRWLSVRYRRWQDRIDAGVAYAPEASANLGSWNAPGVIDEADPTAAPVAGSEARRCRVQIGAGTKFLRLRVE